MKLNRSHALFLVGTIAAAGCVVKESDDDGNGGESGEGSGAKGGSGGKGGTAGSSNAGTSTGGWAGKAGGAGTAGQGYGGKAGSSSTAGSSNVAGAAGEAGADTGNAGNGGASGEGGAGGEGGAAECNDEGATPVSCSGLNSDACSITEFLDAECAMFWQVMKPGAANRARQCMLDLEEDALCDATNTYACIDEALKASCPDETVADDCESIVSSCAAGESPVTNEDCASYLNGLNGEGRDQMVSCMTANTYCDLHTCAEGLSAP